MSNPTNSRRDFLKTTAATAAAASISQFASTSRAAQGEDAPKSDKVPIAVIGAGDMARGNINAASDWVDLVAISDVNASHRESMNKTLAGGKADLYEDYRAILDRDDIKLIHIATPDHWHTKPLVEAMLAGKHIYCEKPLTLTIDEGKLIRKVQKETGSIVQVGTQQRSTFNLFVKAMAIVAEGRLGRIHQVQAAIGMAPSSPPIPVADVPKQLNWDRWLGPAPKVDYRLLKQEGGRPWTNGDYEFRWWYQYSGGKLTDWGAHHVDICNWALKLNGQTEGPLSIGGVAKHPVEFRERLPDRERSVQHGYEFQLQGRVPGRHGDDHPQRHRQWRADHRRQGPHLCQPRQTVRKARRRPEGEPAPRGRDRQGL